jgi:CubicO group peptidase (beta-lactamase class C family)
MITEGKLKLEDKVADFFPDDLPANPHPFIRQATVRDVLMMSTFNARSTGIRPGQSGVWSFFNTGEPLRPSGMIFAYDTAGTNTLAAIIEKQTGKPFLDYMRPKILDPIGISDDAYCIQNIDGRSWSGSGVLCTTRDLARFALLCMNQGAYEGQQLVDKEYMKAATSRQIENAVGRSESEMRHGYGYQFWCLQDGGFAGYGMGGQFMFCMPKYDIILCTTADVQLDNDGLGDIQDGFMALLKRTGARLPNDAAAQKKLSSRLASLAFRTPDGAPTSTAASRYGDKVFQMETNPMGLSTISLSFKTGEATFNYKNETGDFALRIGLGQYISQSFPEPYSGKVYGVNDTFYETIAGGGWVGENVFKCTVKTVGTYLGTLRMQFVFRDDIVYIQMVKVAEGFFDKYQGVALGRI